MDNFYQPPHVFFESDQGLSNGDFYSWGSNEEDVANSILVWPDTSTTYGSINRINSTVFDLENNQVI